MFGGLVIPVVVGGVIAAHFFHAGIEELVGRPLPNELFTFSMALFPFLGIRILDRLLIRLSLYFRRRDADGNPLEAPIRHTYWLIPLPVWSYVWLVLIVGLTVWSAVDPLTDEEEQQVEETWERWIEKRRASREAERGNE